MSTVNAKQSFGGDWTQEKLERVGRYLKTYTTALKNQKFRLVYIDAFAGTGYWSMKNEDDHTLIFPDQISDEIKALRDGSARIALETIPSFDDYYFIEDDLNKCRELEKLKDTFPDKARNIFVINEDANIAISEICKTNWVNKCCRGVIFIDPFGMNVSWDAVRAVAMTKAIDMWYLFPLGGVSRMMRKDGEIPLDWQKRLDDLLGDGRWRNIFYKTERSVGLFDEKDILQRDSGFEKIKEYFLERLETIFCGVARSPLFLRNSKNVPLFLLCFACNNERGASIAIRIAQHILKKK